MSFSGIIPILVTAVIIINQFNYNQSSSHHQTVQQATSQAVKMPKVHECTVCSKTFKKYITMIRHKRFAHSKLKLDLDSIANPTKPEMVVDNNQITDENEVKTDSTPTADVNSTCVTEVKPSTPSSTVCNVDGEEWHPIPCLQPLPNLEGDAESGEGEEIRCRLEIGPRCCVTAKKWKGEMRIDVRRYNFDFFPTKKGISLNLSRWLILGQTIKEIDQALADIKGGTSVSYMDHLGGNVYVTISNTFPIVNIRQWYVCPKSDTLKPGNKGIALSPYQWSKLKDVIAILPEEYVPELKTAKPCYASDDHANQEGYFNCPECRPSDRIYL